MPLRFPTARRILALRELPAQPTEKALSRRDNEAFTQFFLEKIWWGPWALPPLALPAQGRNPVDSEIFPSQQRRTVVY